jgi:cytochrome b
MENKQFIKVWDIAIRVFHWALVVCFAIAFISSEESRKLHVIFGYSVLFLVLFRILYGFVGTRYARFSDFLYHPAQIGDYLKGLLIGRAKHYIGHNPAGGFMIFIMLLSLLFLTLTGLKAYGVWVLSILSILSYIIAKSQNEPPWKIVGEHLLIAILVIGITHWVGDWLANLNT